MNHKPLSLPLFFALFLACSVVFAGEEARSSAKIDDLIKELKSDKAESPEGGSAAVLYADGRVIFRYDRGLVQLVEASPSAYKVTGSFTPPTAAGPAWAHPVILDKKLYLRHDDILLCYDVSEGK